MTRNEQLYHARLERRWSQERAAEEAKIARKTYIELETGKRTPQIGTLDLLCQAFHASPSELGYNELGQLLVGEAIASTDRDVLGRSGDLLMLTREQAEWIAHLLNPGENAMTSFDLSKRAALLKMLETAGVVLAAPYIIDTEPWERLSQAVTKPSALNQKTLDHFTELMRISWEFSNSSELEVAERMLPQFLPRLLQVAQHQTEAAALASQGLRLQGLLAAHKLHLEEKVIQSKQAVDHARFSTDGNALVSSLTELAVAYKYANQHHLSLQTYQEALNYADQASPLVQSRVYAASASAFAKAGRGREARFYIDLAHETFPSQPSLDPSVAFADYGVWLLIFYTGLVHLDLGDPEQAWNAFEQIHTVSVSVPERNRLEIVNQQGKAAILLDDLEKYARSLEDGIANSIQIRSK